MAETTRRRPAPSTPTPDPEPEPVAVEITEPVRVSNTSDAATDRLIMVALTTLAGLCVASVLALALMNRTGADAFFVTTGGACVGALAMRARGGFS